MNSRLEVIRAFEDFSAGRMGQIPSVHGAPTEVGSRSGARIGARARTPGGKKAVTQSLDWVDVR